MQRRNHGIREWVMSVVGATSENICSFRVFRILTRSGRSLPACVEDVSRVRLLNANRVTFGHDPAIPIRTETCPLMRKLHDSESEKAQHDDRK
jgi:hypothetical protein